MAGKSCGYLLDCFIEEPERDLTCSICTQVLNDPHSCRNGHNFCKSCIIQALEMKQECPKCNIALKESILTINLAIKNIIEHKIVKCPNLCEWTGKLHERNSHHDTCLSRLINCPLHEWKICCPECTGMMKRGDLQNHVCKNVESGLKIIFSLNELLKTKCSERRQQAANQSTAIEGYITRAEADGSIYCGQVLSGGEKHGFGSLFRDDVCVCHGYFVNDMLSGDRCYLLDDDGSEYTGQMQGGVYHGTGKKVYASGNSYEGQWKDGVFSGKGHWKQSDGLEYIGDFANDTMHGKGKITYSDSATYEGDFVAGDKHGTGCLKSPTAKGEDYLEYRGSFLNDVADGYGTLLSSDGSLLYKGEFKEDVRHGQGVGVVTSQDQQYTYDGQWERDIMHGQGVLTGVNGDKFRYSGSFVNGEKHGHGVLYVGAWEDDERHGKGTETFPNGDKYTGDFVRDARMGKGEYVWADGQQYMGQWENNQSHGKGTLSYADGTLKYSGQFLNDKMHGRGILTGPANNKFRYSGSFVNGKRHGHGIHTFPTGCTYHGEWKEDKYHGTGTETYRSGHKFDGEFVDGQKHSGVLTYSNGEKYTGQWKNDMFHGEGTMTNADGTVKYVGQYADNEMHGVGVFTWPDGSKFEGNFAGGKRISGKQTTSSGTILEGNLINEKFQGQVTYTYPRYGFKYVGEVVDGKRHGRGCIEATDTGFLEYDGEWQNDQYHGKGSLISGRRGECIYTGDFQQNKKHGVGIYRFRGLVYEGEWRNDQFHGTGTLKYTNSKVYVGEFVCGKKHGKGEQTIAESGDHYTGEWQANKYHGRGTLTLVTEGTVYTGAFANGVYHGFGKLIYSNGNIYEGQWKVGAKNGVGCEKYNNNDLFVEYRGSIVDGKKHGRGKLTFANGDIYTGEFKDDKMHGKGQLKRRGVRNLLNGEWVEGVLQQQENEQVIVV